VSSLKNVSQGPPEAAQPLLPGINFAKLLLVDFSTVCTCARGADVAGFIFCEDAPWKCPGSVPPTCNTGVHVLGSAAASEDLPGKGQAE